MHLKVFVVMSEREKMPATITFTFSTLFLIFILITNHTSLFTKNQNFRFPQTKTI